MRLALLFCATLLLTARAYDAQPEKVDPQDVYLILKGVLEGVQAESHLDLDSIVACIKDSETVFNKLYKAVQLLQTNDFDNVKVSLARAPRKPSS